MKYYKLGESANSFHDYATKKKVLFGQVVPFTQEELKSQKTRAAITGQHLVQATEEEYQAFSNRVAEQKEATTDNDKEQAQSSNKKMTKAEWVEKITSEFELEDDDLKQVKKMNLAELETYYGQLTEEAGDDNEDPDDGGDD